MTKKTQIIKKVEPVNFILDEIAKSLKHIFTAASAYVKLIDRDIEFKKKLIEKAEEKGIPFGVRDANWLEQIGRGNVHWQLYLSRGHANGSYIRKLPFSEQKEILENQKKYQLLLTEGDHIQVDVTKISREQSKQIFGNGYIRDLAEQKAYQLENPAVLGKPTEAKDDYQIMSGGKVKIGGIIFTRNQIKHILLEM